MYNQYFIKNYSELIKRAEEKITEALEIVQFFVGKFEAQDEYYKKSYLDEKSKTNKEKGQILNIPYNKGDILDMKNVRIRKDGRYEYRKVIDGKRHYIYSHNLTELKKLIKNFKPKEKTISRKFINLIKEWFETYKSGKITSERNYISAINNHFNENLFQKDIHNIKLFELQTFLNNINGHRIAKYCYFIIKGVYFFALKNEIINRDISQFLEKPKNNTIKRESLNLAEQKLILENLNKSTIKNEILFYLLTGCRRTEAVNIKIEDINFEKNTIFINGTKTRSSKRYIPISETFKNILKENFQHIFKFNSDYYTREFTKYCHSLNLKNITLHNLRHTFSTNLYYLGVPDKQRQQYMGHSSIVITNDIYTTLDPNITKKDIIKLYNNLYPNF